MFTNYLKLALRNIRRNLSYTTLNVAGLMLSIASCIIIFLVVKNELTYDRYHKKSDRTYRVTLNAIDFNPSVSMAVTVAMRNDFPELENVAQFWYTGSGLLQVGESRFNEEGLAYADDQFPQVFDFNWLEGDKKTALTAPKSIVLTKTLAKKYFGSKPALGQTIKFDNSNTLLVTGIIDDLPGNTHLPFKYLISFETIKKDMGGAMREFYWISGANTYIVVPENYSIHQLEKQIPAFLKKNWGEGIAKEARLPLQPLKDIHFDQRYLHNDVMPTTSRNTYIALAVVALFIIITACINFINLATALAMKRVKEVGIRKTLGAGRGQLIRQFLGETGLLVILAVLLGYAIAYIFLPKVAGWLDIRIGVEQMAEPITLITVAGLTVLIILLAGLYPAFVQSAFRPGISLKSSGNMSFRGLTLRKSLVFLQFAISQILIVGTLVVAQQMDFFRNKDLGFNKNAVISFFMFDAKKREIMAQQLRTDPGVKDFVFSASAPIGNGWWGPFSAPHLGIDKDDVTQLLPVDTHYLRMFDIKLLAGEPIKIRKETDSPNNVLVNETLIKKLGFNDPQKAVGQHFRQAGNTCVILGVVQDFQTESKHKARRPCILMYEDNAFFSASVRLDPHNMQQTIARIEKGWSALVPDQLFHYEFIDDRIAAMYRQEQKAYTAFRMFSVLAIIIGCLGLYGLVAFAGVQRTKEVGIRKVLGASIPDIIMLFAKEFLLLIVIAFVIAAPVAWFVMNNWLDNFAYRIHVGVITFAVAIAASFIIAAITIAHQSIKAAIANPVKSLRTE
jgi:ABC-type lipoprotein release transport system permease subunit